MDTESTAERPVAATSAAPEFSVAEIELAQGRVRVREIGSGEPIVFVHGLLVDGELWNEVALRLADRFRCIVPDWPFGAHRITLDAGTDLSPPGLARLVADLIAALGHDRATVVGNDTGGAIVQILAANHRERLARLVLTNCDAYENFLPPAFRYLQLVARIPGGLGALAQSTRLDLVRRSPIAFGWLTAKPIPGDLLDRWTRPAATQPAVRRDLAKILRGISSRYTLEAARALRTFDRPTLIAWGIDDRFFKLRFAERLAAEIPNARLETIAGARTFVALDQPQRLAELIADGAAGS